MSLRNELRGPFTNTEVWYKYIWEGSHLVHRINPNLLVIISGLNYDNDLSHLKKRPLDYTLNNKVVLEAHLYSFSGDPESKFVKKPLNIICDQIMDKFEREAGFVVDMDNNPYPLFLSEFGYDQSRANEAENRFMSCFLARIAAKDIDWALWAFQGSYMYRQGREDPDESFGVMDHSWTKDRNPKLRQMLQLAQRINQGYVTKITFLIYQLAFFYFVFFVNESSLILFCRSKFESADVVHNAPSGVGPMRQIRRQGRNSTR